MNDLKTKILPSSEPIEDLWAHRLRELSQDLATQPSPAKIGEFFETALTAAKSIASQSPLKLAVRRADRYQLYGAGYESAEPYLQRIAFHAPHALDYICLFVAKRVAIGGEIDRSGWTEVINQGLKRHVLLGHHHESCWLFWLSVALNVAVDEDIIELVPRQNNLHLKAMLVRAYADGRLKSRPSFSFKPRISSEDRDWLVNLVARSSGVTRASFGGCYADECEHLCSRGIQLVDFEHHFAKLAIGGRAAISNARFGYEDGDEDGDVGDEGEPIAWEDLDF